MATFISAAIAVPSQTDLQPFVRADLHFYGVDHSGASYEARVFLNRPGANAETPLITDQGYAGSFFVFGHGGCFGDEGHCDATQPPASPFDQRLPHQLTPTTKTVEITEVLRKLVGDGSMEITFKVGVVVVLRESPFASLDQSNEILRFEGLSLITYV